MPSQAKFKVFGGVIMLPGSGQHRVIVAAKSMKKAHALVGRVSYTHMRKHWAITANAEELAAAEAAPPGQVLARQERWQGPYIPIEALELG